jgi:hypothetical protein
MKRVSVGCVSTSCSARPYQHASSARTPPVGRSAGAGQADARADDVSRQRADHIHVSSCASRGGPACDLAEVGSTRAYKYYRICFIII